MAKKDVLRAVKEKCLDCSADQPKEVRLCVITHCSLYRYRFGKDPYSKRKGNVANLVPFRKKMPGNSTQETAKTAQIQGVVK